MGSDPDRRKAQLAPGFSSKTNRENYGQTVPAPNAVPDFLEFPTLSTHQYWPVSLKRFAWTAYAVAEALHVSVTPLENAEGVALVYSFTGDVLNIPAAHPEAPPYPLGL